MDKEIPLHPFETFPRGELFPGLSRRQFFKSLAVEAKLFALRSEGANALRISSLGCMPDDLLAEIIPKMIPNCEIDLKDQKVWGLLPERERPVVLFELDELSGFAFNLINGINSLGEIAGQLADYASLPLERAFAFTRGLFLTLVKNGACLPANNPMLG